MSGAEPSKRKYVPRKKSSKKNVVCEKLKDNSIRVLRRYKKSIKTNRTESIWRNRCRIGKNRRSEPIDER